TCLAVVSALAADFVYDRVKAAPPEARLVSAQGGHVAIPLAEVSDGDLHIYTVEIQGAAVRLLVIRKPNGWGTALDACQICGPVNLAGIQRRARSEEHTSELQSPCNLVCRLLLEKKKRNVRASFI